MENEDPVSEMAALIDGILRGEARAERRLHDEFCEKCKILIRVRIPDCDSPEDICQDLILALLAAIRKNSIEDMKKLPAFARRICSNKISDWLRANRRTDSLENTSEEKLIDKNENGNPENEALAHERYEILARALDKLDSRTREVITLHYYEELKFEEIAEHLHISHTLARHIAFQGRKELWNWLDKFGYFD